MIKYIKLLGVNFCLNNSAECPQMNNEYLCNLSPESCNENEECCSYAKRSVSNHYNAMNITELHNTLKIIPQKSRDLGSNITQTQTEQI